MILLLLQCCVSSVTVRVMVTVLISALRRCGRALALLVPELHDRVTSN